METLKHPPMYVKAVYAAVVTFLGGLLTAIADGITAEEWIGMSLTTIVVTGGVFGLTNARMNGDTP